MHLTSTTETCQVKKPHHPQKRFFSPRIDLYTAALGDGDWTDWQNRGEPFNVAYQVGEMHITADGRSLYLGSDRPGGYGGVDLWVSEKIGDTRNEPVNLGTQINADGNENRPFITADGQAVWLDNTSRQGYPDHRSR
jgi:hypothetical protein